MRQNIQKILDQEERGFRLTREINQHKSKLVEKEAQVIQQKKLLQKKLEKLKQKCQLIENRKMDLTESLYRCVTGTEDLQENEAVLEKNIKMRQTMFHTLNRRKKELIADLFSIYPIEQVRKKSVLFMKESGHCFLIKI